VKRIMLLAVITGGLMVPATAGASGGIGAGGVAACAAANGASPGAFAPVTSLSGYPGPPGPFAGPNSVFVWAPFGKNNGTSLVAFCTQ
jgi:hypothetical protein